MNNTYNHQSVTKSPMVIQSNTTINISQKLMTPYRRNNQTAIKYKKSLSASIYLKSNHIRKKMTPIAKKHSFHFSENALKAKSTSGFSKCNSLSHISLSKSMHTQKKCLTNLKKVRRRPLFNPSNYSIKATCHTCSLIKMSSYTALRVCNICSKISIRHRLNHCFQRSQQQNIIFDYK